MDPALDDISNIKLVSGAPRDLNELKELFVNTINAVCCLDYNSSQIDAWTSGVNSEERWNKIVYQQYLIVAKLHDQVVEFGSLERGDYLDMLFVHRDFQKLGIAKLIYQALEREAFRTNKNSLFANVSITAKPFFLNQGFQILTEQEVERDGVKLTNYRMVKELANNNSPDLQTI